MPTLDDLASWTPVALNFDGQAPSIDWCDLRGLRFEEPFFDQTVARAVAGSAGRALIRTDLAALEALDSYPSLDPAGLVFHLSRCGSTLVPRLLSLVPGVVAVSEPGPVNSLLALDPATVDPAIQVQVLRLLVRALGRRRFAEDCRLVVKLSSWNVRFWPLFRAAFPECPTIWLQREPVEVMASLLDEPPGWLAAHPSGAGAAALFGLDGDASSRIDRAEFAADALAALLSTAASLPARVWDYRDLPEAIATEIAPFFAISPGEGDRARMAERARRHAKRLDEASFEPDRRADSVSARVSWLAAERLDPLYRTLAHRDCLTEPAHAPSLVEQRMRSERRSAR